MKHYRADYYLVHTGLWRVFVFNLRAGPMDRYKTVCFSPTSDEALALVQAINNDQPHDYQDVLTDILLDWEGT